MNVFIFSRFRYKKQLEKSYTLTETDDGKADPNVILNSDSRLRNSLTGKQERDPIESNQPI